MKSWRGSASSRSLTNSSRSGDFRELEKYVRQLRSELAAAWVEIDYHKRRWAAVSGKKPDTGQLNSRVLLHDLILAHFDMDELMQLCFDTGVMWDMLPGDDLGAKARALILKMERDGRTYQLIGECQKVRPDVDWPAT